MLGSGFVKINSTLNKDNFYYLMQKLQPYFKVFTYSGILIFVGLGILVWSAFKVLAAKKENDFKMVNHQVSFLEEENVTL